MPPQMHRDASFVIRIWWERQATSRPVWRGQIIHAQSGQTVLFQHLHALSDFIERCTGAAVLILDDDEGDR